MLIHSSDHFLLSVFLPLRDLHLDDAMENSNNSDINNIGLLFSRKDKFKSRGWLVFVQGP